MAVFKATSSFEVNPRGWSKLSDEDIVRMFDAFNDWLVMNEEHMTFVEADKAWKMYDKWLDYLEKRGLKEADQSSSCTPISTETVGTWTLALVE